MTTSSVAQPVKAPVDASPTVDTPALTREDVALLNRQSAERDRQWGGLRIKVAAFRCPWPCTRSQYEQVRKAAVDKWIATLDKQGWDLKSRVHVATNKRRPAFGYHGDWGNVPQLDMVEIPVAAAFQIRKLEHRRIEVPVQD